MKCPVCDVDLLIADRQGIEIDYCPKCRGVWLDRGELDKIIDRSANVAPAVQSYGTDYRGSHGHYSPAPPAYHQEHHYPQHHGYHHGHHPKRKHKSFLDEIFDFD